MKISKVSLHNFRIYKDVNELSFAPFSEKNISVIAGRNGYGKTTLLTSLLWAFYGKLIGQVENKYRLDIKQAGGYPNYLISLLNRDVKANSSSEEQSFYVEIKLEELSIPALSCNSITIRRSYNLGDKEEKLNILIDGSENELTKEVGYELFINDFILPREIAKFFFFDAEKIVSLAEAKSLEELRSLNKAYSEVLGIKKYEELKKNLESLRSKLIRDEISDKERKELEELYKKADDSSKLLEYNLEQQQEVSEELSNLKQRSSNIQEKLIREGNSITLEELKELKKDRDTFKKESAVIKSELSSILDLAPLVLAGKKLTQLKEQLDLEFNSNIASDNIIKKEITSFSNTLLEKLKKSGLKDRNEFENIIESVIEQRFEKTPQNTQTLLAFNEEKYRNFNALYSNIKGAYSSQLKNIVQREKNNRVLLSRTLNKIKQAEARKDNHLAVKLREEKMLTDRQIDELELKNRSLSVEEGTLSAKNSSDKKLVSEREKKFNLVEIDNKKLKATQNLLERINSLITRIKEDKKYTLQKGLKLILNKLMHKGNFINDVKIIINDDTLIIDLIDENGFIIDKETLSKGEQQLYATALLKALVDESGIKFPVFIDSPLQKFDKFHSQNIIEEFYPTISEQVVLLPLLEKELTEKEYRTLKPNLHNSYMIDNINHNSSSITNVDLDNVFNELNEGIYV
ncbi:DNA sulfur modification protein DndD [uncultured Maribacter sp.]|uniref:DNA sulfur modification protein DndD n=1 Tax=uncultured Maribacter sp. TaxID=431308 RepID=UPI0026226132|nr:DNA sulfur modification protein DndD [uncultured Maribacter sp.]